jgi:predicted nuclease of predicted toxin-antitoxin system
VAPRFLIDENLSPVLARHRRTAHGFDALRVQELGLRGPSDADILARAIAEDRIIVISNVLHAVNVYRCTNGNWVATIEKALAGR